MHEIAFGGVRLWQPSLYIPWRYWPWHRVRTTYRPLPDPLITPQTSLVTTSPMSGTRIRFYEYSTSADGQSLWSPIPSNVVENCSPITRLGIATYNVWFDKVEKRTRFEAVLRELISIPAIDLVSLQEVTEEFLHWLQESPEIQAHWVLTNCWDSEHQREIPPNWYGCMLLVTKRWAGNVRGWVKRFPTSKMGRFVVMAEIFQNGSSLVLFGWFSLLIFRFALPMRIRIPRIPTWKNVSGKLTST